MKFYLFLILIFINLKYKQLINLYTLHRLDCIHAIFNLIN